MSDLLCKNIFIFFIKLRSYRSAHSFHGGTNGGLVHLAGLSSSEAMKQLRRTQTRTDDADLYFSDFSAIVRH